MAEESTIVQDKAQSRISDLWLKEDYWAIWLGFLIALFGSWLLFFSQAPVLDEKFNAVNQTLKAESEKAPFKTIARGFKFKVQHPVLGYWRLLKKLHRVS